MIKKCYLIGASVGAILTAGAAPAFAQDQGADGRASTLDEVVVTAQRRAERLQDVPIPISSVDAEALATAGISGSEGLQNLVPGLVLNRSSSSLTPVLRGIGHTTGNFGDESPVATYIDGVYQPANGTNIFEFNSIERIEVLRGPQGTLFGRNATGGVIQVITRDPSQTAALEGSLGYGAYDTVDVRLYGNMPLSDTVSVNLAALYHDQKDGWGRNPYLGGQKIRKDQSKGLRAKLLWTPTDNVQLLLGASYSKLDSDKGYIALFPGALGSDGSRLGRFFDATSVTPQENNNRVTGQFAKLTYDLGPMTLVNILSHADAKISNVGDTVALPTFLNIATGIGREKTISNETQLMSNPDSPFEWIAGFFYFKDDLDVDVTVQRTGALIHINTKQKLRSYAPYAQVTAPITSRTRLTAGIRYTADERTIVRGFQTITTAAGTTTSFDVSPPTQKTNKVTYRLGVDHKFGENTMVYATFNTGFKSGQYNPTSPNLPPVLPELLDAYEIGIKSEPTTWARINVSAFYYDYKDLQVRSISPLGLQSSFNAAKQRSKGIDIEAVIKPTNTLTVTASAEILNAKYVDYRSSPVSFPQIIGGAIRGGNVIISPPPTPVPGGVNDVSGLYTPQSPRFTAQITVRQEIPTAVGEFAVSGTYAYHSKYYWDPDNRLGQRAFGLLSGSVEWWRPKGDLGVRIWGRNLTDKRYASFAFGGGATGDIFTAAEPRTGGVAVLFKY